MFVSGTVHTHTEDGGQSFNSGKLLGHKRSTSGHQKYRGKSVSSLIDKCLATLLKQ